MHILSLFKVLPYYHLLFLSHNEPKHLHNHPWKKNVNFNTHLSILFTYTRFKRSSVTELLKHIKGVIDNIYTCILSSAVHYFATLKVIIKLDFAKTVRY